MKGLIPTNLKRRLKIVIYSVSRKYRDIPDFIIIGAMKSGTSSLFAYLSQHPKLYPSRKKEVHYFDGGLDIRENNFRKGVAWYRSHFPSRKQMGPNAKTFEASPSYLFHPLAPKRIFDLVPKAKLIAVLRNPTDRAISHYFHEKRRKRETLKIREALRSEEKRLAPVLKNRDFNSTQFLHQSYKKRGLYVEQINSYFKHFSRDQLLLLSSEELFAQTEQTLRRVFDFLEVDTSCQIKDLRPRNVAANRRYIEPEVYGYLNDYFRPYNQALYNVVGRSFGW